MTPSQFISHRGRVNVVARGGTSSVCLLFLLAGIVGVPASRAGELPAEPKPSVAGPEAATGPVEGDRPANTAATQPSGPVPALTGDALGFRKTLLDHGIAFSFDFQVDGSKSLHGGLNTRASTWRSLSEATLDVDTERLFGLKGGRIFVDFQNADGPNSSDKLVGDVQGIDGLDGVPRTPHQDRTQLAQLWYEQKAFDGVLRVKAGKVDANSEFDRSPTALEFLNQSTGSSATLFTMPTYPDPATGINIFLTPVADLQLGFGLYDGSLASGVRTGALGPRNFFRNPQRLFLIAEIDKTWALGPNRLAGRLGVGGWYSTNKFQRLAGGETTGTGGPYVVLDQILWRASPRDDEDPRGIALYFMGGYADPAVINTDYHLGSGISWKGPIPGRTADIWGVGLNSVHLSDAVHPLHSFETSYETFYRLQITRWFSLKPDLQYVVHPGGGGVRDAVVATIRFELAF